MKTITVTKPSTYSKQPKTCLVCGATYQGTKAAKFCSNKCRQRNKRGKG